MKKAALLSIVAVTGIAGWCLFYNRQLSDNTEFSSAFNDQTYRSIEEGDSVTHVYACLGHPLDVHVNSPDLMRSYDPEERYKLEDLAAAEGMLSYSRPADERQDYLQRNIFFAGGRVSSVQYCWSD